MKTRNFKILLIVLVLIIISLFFIINLYNKPFIDIKKSNPELEVTAQEILDDYLADEYSANEKYVDNLIQIKGEIAEISFDKGVSIITLKDRSGFSSIICHMLPEANLNVLKLKKGSQITIKGVCTGYLFDIMMVRCILTNSNFNEK
ncbi:MAG: OB-fold protein [Lutibacter sp.]|nr:MAG: hypothetical protein APF83_10615 [Lutibacter sp. BRH_c52]HCE53971.1 hypothetical protein [Lutibacter sp.]